MIFYLIFLTIIILTIKFIYEIHNINSNAVLEQLQSANSEEIFEHLKERKPLLIHNLVNKYEKFNNLSFEKLSGDNPGLIILDNNRYLSLKSFNEEQNMYLYKNKDLYETLHLKELFDTIYIPFYSHLHTYKRYLMSLYKGLNSIELTKNKHNLCLINQIYGQSKLYLFNPKHKNDIINKPNDSIKKYGQKINLTQGLSLSIPVEWYYFYECENESIIGEIVSDNYFTVIYNNLR
tara:strand:+ start:423 stop:1127 length:705 start_codon:yes stop_codon:yes gene_type:complete